MSALSCNPHIEPRFENTPWIDDLNESVCSRVMVKKFFYFLFERKVEIAIGAKKLAVIHLIRNNFVDLVLSTKLIMEHKPEIWAGFHYTKTTSFSFDEMNSQLTHYRDSVRLYSNKLEKLNARNITVYYDDLVEDPQKTLDLVSEFLGIPTAKYNPSWFFIKQRNKPQSHYIENYHALKKSFNGTEFYDMFTG